MKAKYIVSLQLLFLAGAVIAGTLLNSNLADGPRDMHRLMGMLGGLFGLIAAIVVTMQGTVVAKIFAWLAFLLSVVAGAAGRSLKTASDYDKSFMIMRGAGVLALLCAIVVMVILMKNKVAAKTSTESDSSAGDDA